MRNVEIDALSSFLGSYLGQDWPTEFQSSTEALAAIIGNEPRDLLIRARQEIDALIALNLDEGLLEVVLRDQAGCYFAPESEGQTFRSWLLHVRNIFETASLQ